MRRNGEDGIRHGVHRTLTSVRSMSCWVSQSWAGAGWGGMVIPRIGMEVVAEFLKADKLLVTGCVAAA